MLTTRLAPSPTGALHLGNARTFVLTWAWARAHGAALPLRMEDLDSPRKKPWAHDQALEDLRWLGVDWDGPVLVQSTRHLAHVAALNTLIGAGAVYPCSCSRKDVVSAQGAPHAEDELQYPGTCRGRWAGPEDAFADVHRPVAWRFRVTPCPVPFDDAIQGRVELDPASSGGDFVVARWTPDRWHQVGYQLAVVVDDAAANVDTVIRGDDLVPSTPRQILLQRALGLPTPSYAHLPLVVGEDGRRLAKRHGDTRIAAYREAGVTSDRIRRWIASTSGVLPSALDDPKPDVIRWSLVPRQPVVVRSHPVPDGPPD